MSGRPTTESRRAPAIEVGTRVAETEAASQAFAESVAATEIDPAVWTGAFATNVWGGRYEIEGVLGKGGQGTTFTGVDRKTGARVAVKVFDLKHAADWKRVDLFEREVATLKRIEHPGIPRFLDLLEDPDTGARALVMTQVPGEPLSDVLERDGVLAEKALWHVLLDVTDVLAALHDEDTPIVHRDIKPRNLIRRPDGKISVVDFGGVGHARGQTSSTVVGTFGYMAPEQLYGHASPATDMYALGATILTLATGIEPEDQPRDGLGIDVDQAAPALSPDLRRVLKRLLAPEPKNRPLDARALVGELTRLREPQPVEDPFDPKTEAKFRTHEDIDEAANVLAGMVALVVGVLGTVAAVALGEIVVPLVLAILHAFAQGPAKPKIERARVEVDKVTKIARKTFSESIEKGVRTLQEVEHRDKRRKATERDARRKERQLRREERRGKVRGKVRRF